MNSNTVAAIMLRRDEETNMLTSLMIRTSNCSGNTFQAELIFQKPVDTGTINLVEQDSEDTVEEQTPRLKQPRFPLPPLAGGRFRF